MLTAICIAIASYFTHGEAEYIFKSTSYGPTLSLTLGLGVVVGLFGAHGIFLTHKKKNT